MAYGDGIYAPGICCECECCAAPGGCGLFWKSALLPCWTCFDIVRQDTLDAGGGDTNACVYGTLCGGAYTAWFLPACLYGTSSWSGLGSGISSFMLGYYNNRTMKKAKNAGILRTENGCSGCCDNKCDPTTCAACNFCCAFLCPTLVLVQTRNTQLRLPDGVTMVQNAYMAPKQMCLRM